MSKLVNKEKLLHQLQCVSHGLSPRDIIEQSSCFVFKDGEIMTYNDEVACRVKTDIKLAGAVRAKPLMSLLEKLDEEEVTLTANEGELTVEGKGRRRAGIQMENEVLLPVGNVDRPEKFKDLHVDFIDAVNTAKDCTLKDQSKFWATCVNLHPKWIESSNDAQIFRHVLPTNIKKPTLVRGSSIKSIVDVDVTQFSETENWLHFRNKDGLIVSIRRYFEDTYPSDRITQIIKFSGTKIILPKGLGEATDRASIFSEENAEDDCQVLVTLQPGKIRVRGQGVSGWYTETKKLRYKGPALDFCIQPRLLAELTRKYEQCEITNDRLKVNGGAWSYVTCLSSTGDERDEEERSDE